MRQTKLFTKTRKETPSDETAKNAQLLIRAGYVYKVMAGVYAYTPLGLKVLENIKQIVREEMNAIDGQELIMTSLQSPEVWQSTGRWDNEAVDVWFKTKLQDGTELGLAWSHEETIMAMVSNYISSYKDLPFSVYQFQTKLRNELRAKSGIMRGREFVMKDMYSLHASKEDMDAYYDKVIGAYKIIYERLGLGNDTHVTFAGGGAFTKFSHEFQTVCEAGEDILYINQEKNIAVNEEVLEDATKELGVAKNELVPVKSAEVGNIFKFGTEKGEKMNVTYKDADGIDKPVYLASYGIGITRVMGVLVEKFSDDKGIVWPSSVSPYKLHLVGLNREDAAICDFTDGIYDALTEKGIEVLYDDREVRVGEKFADSDLIGIPYRVVVSKKTKEEGKFEVITRATGEVRYLSEEELYGDFDSDPNT
ncbi:MAG: prolyl-tRNA synthetase [Candidatus Pacebacteria bacterium]|nr:prolyl-tRNA synthetase [Candidatus Paceibacterota bacterium]